jgi:dephospho-CoA kinase
MAVYIGLTGPLGSGKGTVAEILKKTATDKGLKVIYRSLSDEVRREVSRQGKKQERSTLKETADKFRLKVGSGAWGKSVAYTIKKETSDLPAGDFLHLLVIIDGIRNPKEVFELRTQFGIRFKLLAVMAPTEIIQGNIQRRKRKDEGEHILMNDEKILELYESEMGASQPIHGHNVTACVELADLPILNNDGSISELEEDVNLLVKQHILPLLQNDNESVQTSIKNYN